MTTKSRVLRHLGRETGAGDRITVALGEVDMLRRMGLPLARALTLVVVGLTVVGSAQPRSAIEPNGTLVFDGRPIVRGEVDFKKPPQIYRVKTDGTGLTHLAKNAAEPAASPDGSQLAFVRDGIWVMDSNGRDQRQILRSKRWTQSPTWSADGATLFFLREDGIYRMRADGSGERRVVKATCLDDLTASPNGRDLAYVEWPSESSRDECDGWPPAINASDLSGRNERTLSAGRWAESPAWSPDGTLLAFNSVDAVNGPPFGIYIVGPGKARRLTSRTGSPTWSPAGTEIAFADGDLWIIRSDGKRLRRVKHLPRLDLSDPVWLPAAGG